MTMYPQPKHYSVLSFIDKYHLEKEDSITHLKTLQDNPSTIGFLIDGVKLLLDIENNVKEAEPLSIMTTAFPVTAYKSLGERIEQVEKLEEVCANNRKTLKPIVVFGGCGFTPTERMLKPPMAPPASIAERCATEDAGISLVDRTAVEVSAVRYFLEEDIEAFLVRQVHQRLREHGETMRAPYLAWSQISSMLAPGYAVGSEVYGSIELLAFPGVDRVITSIDPLAGTFKYVSKEDLFKAVERVAPDKTKEDICAALLITSINRDFIIGELIERMDDAFMTILRNEEPIVNMVSSFAIQQNIRTQVQRSLSALEAPVLTRNGEIKLLREIYNTPPSQPIVQFFGKPLTSIMYYLMASGPLIPAPFASVGQFYLWDQWPLVDSKLFRSESEYIISLRAQTLHHLNLRKEGRGDRRLNWQRDYNFRTSRTTTIAIPSATTLCQWRVNPEDFPEGVPVYFYNVLSKAEESLHAPKEVQHIRVSTIPTTLAVVLLRTIDLLGYISHRESMYSSLSQIGKCLEVFDCPTLSEYGLLFIELLRTQTLNDLPITLTVANRSKNYPAGVRFAARLLSIVHINSSGPWEGPIDPEIAAFGTCSRTLCRTLRCLAEAVTTNIFMEKTTCVPLDMFSDVVNQLPFNLATEFNAGILVMHILMNNTCTLDSLKVTFPQLFSLETDLCTLRYFWEKAVDAFNVLRLDSEEQANFLAYSAPFDAADMLMREAFNRILGKYYPS